MNSIKINLYPENIALGNNGLLKHQEDTIEALRQKQLVINCAMTGAGKTKAAHLGIKTQAYDKSVLFVAPTNALVSQHLVDAKEFVSNNALPHHVVAVNGEILYKLQKKYSIHRSSEVLHQIIYNPRAFSKDFGIHDDDQAPLWLITNPDQIWLSIIVGRQMDTRNLLKDFIDHFRFVLVDEFHYYTAEQLTLFFLCIAFWQHFGQFDDGLKMLLLTATPDEMVETFFQRMNIDYSIVAKQDANSSLCAAPSLSTPVLSPVELTLTTGYMNDFTHQVMDYYNQGKNGVIISDSLFEINKTYKLYKDKNPDMSVGRITGAINNKQRKEEAKQRVILATQTVDLGYNFVKPVPKDGQEIEFLFSTARTNKAFWQRLGRAGRVLGKKVINVPSYATMILSDTKAFNRLESFNGQSMTRNQFSQLFDLQDTKMKSYALTREGLYTATRQLVEIEKMLPDLKKSIVEKIFETLKYCFDPNKLSYDWPSFLKRHRLSEALRKLDREYEKITPYHIHKAVVNHTKRHDNFGFFEVLIRSWLKNYFFKDGKWDQYTETVKSKDDEIELAHMLINQKQSLKKDIVEYHKEQMLRFNYMFSFRGNGIKDEVLIYDPMRLHSDQLINAIDLIYLLSKYLCKPPLPRQIAERQLGLKLPQGDYVFEIEDFHEYPYVPIFQYDQELPQVSSKKTNHTEPEIMPCYWRTVALHDVSLTFRNKRTGLLPIPLEIKDRLTKFSELFFITPIDNPYTLKKWLDEYDARPGTLNANRQEHSVIFGKDAILISEELYYKSITKKIDQSRKV